MKSRLFAGSTLAGLLFMLIIGIYTVVNVGASTMIPIHFDIGGNPNTFAPAFLAILICPVVFLGVALLIGAKAAAAPPDVALQLRMVRLFVVLTVCGAQSVICLAADDGEISYASVILALAGIVIAMVFNGIGALPRNTVLGIRNRWSLQSEENWFFVQRFSGRLGVFVGTAIAVSSFVLGNTLPSVIVFLTLLAVLVAGTLLYSVRVARNARSAGE